MDIDKADESPTLKQRRPRLRLSLLSFLLLVSLICVSASYFQLSRQNRQLKKKCDDLMWEIGYLVIHNPTKIYFRQIGGTDDLTWSHRVYLPPEREYSLLNNDGWRRSIRNAEQFTITVAVRRDANSKWRVTVKLPNGGVSSFVIDSDVAEKLSQTQYSPFSRSDQKEFDPDQPLDLLRVGDEFRIWIEPAPRPPASLHPSKRK